MQPTSSKEGDMRLLPVRNARGALALDPRTVRVTQREILDDLLYPARARRSGPRIRK
jgi:hypothetical protein